MSQAITRCPECLTSFRVTQTQLRLAGGAVRCGACLHVFEAEAFFVAPILDITERLSIEAEYWATFDTYYLDSLHISVAGLQNRQAPEQATPQEDQGFEEKAVTEEAWQEEGRQEEARQEDARQEEVPQEQVERSAQEEQEEEIEIQQADAALRGSAAPDQSDLMLFYLDYLQSHPGTLPLRDQSIPEEPDRAAERSSSEAPTSERTFASTEDASDHSGAITDSTLIETKAQDSSFDSVAALDEFSDFELSLEHDIDDPLISEAFTSEVLLKRPPGFFSKNRLKWTSGVVIGLFALMIQFAYFNRDTFSQQLEYRDYYVKACRWLGCELAEFSSLAELTTTDLVIRTHPEVPQGLMVDVLLRNLADYRQAFPGLRLRFFDMDGAVVAARTFKVDEYLGGEMRGLRYIPARTEVRLSLEVVDPGDLAFGYEMDVVRF